MKPGPGSERCGRYGDKRGSESNEESKKQLAAISSGMEQPYSSSNLFGYRNASVNAGPFGNLTFNRGANGSYQLNTAGLFDQWRIFFPHSILK